MPLQSTSKYLAAAIVSLLLASTACFVESSSTGPLRTESASVDRDKTEIVEVELKLGAGELKIRPGGDKLMEADFTYNEPSSKPIVRYNAMGFRGRLTIEQPSAPKMMNNAKYVWDLRLNEHTPMDMTVHLGAGEARLDLGGLAMRSLNINMGVGSLRLDLRGAPKNDYDVHIHGGIGEATVYLPGDVGIVAEAHGGIGGVSAHGLEKRNGRWVNRSQEHAPVTIHLDVNGGIGSINLIAG